MCIDMLILWQAKALQSVKHVDACCIHGETNVTWWHGSRQSHHDDHAHNIAWICTYGNRLEHIPTLQGQELSWLERVTHVAMRVHHTKWTITHTCVGIYIYIYTYIMYNAITQSRKVNKHCQRSKGMAQQGTGNVKQTLPYPGNVAQVRSRKSKRVQGEEES